MPLVLIIIVILSILSASIASVHLQTLKRSQSLADARQANEYARSGAQTIASYIAAKYGSTQPMTAKALTTLNQYTNPSSNIGQGTASVTVQGMTLVATAYTELQITATSHYRNKVGHATLNVHYRTDKGAFYTGKPVDITAPAAPIVNKVTKQTTTVTGTAEANSTITIKKGTTTLSTTVTTAGGNFAATISKQSKDTVLSITAKDADGNISTATKVTVTNN